jgi:hypothetical protein
MEFAEGDELSVSMYKWLIILNLFFFYSMIKDYIKFLPVSGFSKPLFFQSKSGSTVCGEI